MKARHLFMISLGEVIGSGLFLGSALGVPFVIACYLIYHFKIKKNRGQGDLEEQELQLQDNKKMVI